MNLAHILTLIAVQVFSWEPIRCHDAVDVGWSRLSDLNIQEEKLLGCSYNQSCVGVWVVDLSVWFNICLFNSHGCADQSVLGLGKYNLFYDVMKSNQFYENT